MPKAGKEDKHKKQRLQLQETAAQRRARRLLADPRLFGRLLKAGQAAAAHHNAASALVRCLRGFLTDSKVQKEGWKTEGQGAPEKMEVYLHGDPREVDGG